MKYLVLLGLIAFAAAFPTPLRNFPHRIVGGTEAGKNELPYQISLRQNGNHICGGTILNANYVVCAAHCTQGSVGTYSVVAGEHNFDVNDGTEQTRSINRIVNHPNYSSATLANDISLLRTSSPFTLSNVVRAMPMANQGQSSSGDSLVSGWGSTQEGGSVARTLRKVTVPIMTDAVCRSYYGNSQVHDSMICAGFPNGGKDSCQGDSGGPLVCSGGSYLCGIVSWGIGCARPGYPGVYTEVSHFRTWINANAI